MTTKRKIEQYTEDGKFVASYLNLAQAAAANFRTIAAINHALTGRTKTCGGYIWKYAEQEEVSSTEEEESPFTTVDIENDEVKRLEKKLDDLTQKFDQLSKLMRLNPQSCELWNARQLGEYFKMSAEHVRRWITTDPRFPPPVDIKGRTSEKSGKKLWVSGDVIAFALKYRQKKPKVFTEQEMLQMAIDKRK